MKKIKNLKNIFAAILIVFSFIITASAADALIPLGHTAGIKLSSRGAIVIALSEELSENPCKSAGIAPGDIIQKVGDKQIFTNSDLREAVCNSNGNQICVEYLHGEEKKSTILTPVPSDNGEYAIGVFVRDSVAGIGTLTYYDPETRTYGALGHGISDSDTGILIPVRQGSLMKSSVSSVKQGQHGAPGELHGEYDMKDNFATINKNTDSGIFGKVENTKPLFSKNISYPIAKSSEIKRGEATILSNIEGDEVKEYKIEITGISNESEKTKNMLIRVTDKELIEKTGGIVRGMSGSPIIQNGKLIGAVTHVLVNDPQKGYAIFIENMLDAAA